jgi:hypothetical protein
LEMGGQEEEELHWKTKMEELMRQDRITIMQFMISISKELKISTIEECLHQRMR